MNNEKRMNFACLVHDNMDTLPSNISTHSHVLQNGVDESIKDTLLKITDNNPHMDALFNIDNIQYGNFINNRTDTITYKVDKSKIKKDYLSSKDGANVTLGSFSTDKKDITQIGRASCRERVSSPG